MSDPIGLRAAGALHCNLNVSTLAGAVGVYESLGLRVKMRSRAEGQDASAMGLGDITTSEAWFLYDTRGGRGAPAVELVEWIAPKTSGDTYGHPGEVGMQALGFDVPDVGHAVRGRDRQGAPPAPGGTRRCRHRDPRRRWRGLELSPAPVDSSVLRYARIVCADLERSARWYGLLGFDPIGTEGTISWDHAGEAAEVVEQRLSLAGPAPLELRLNAWPSHPATAAHSRPTTVACSAWRWPCRTCASPSTAARQSGAIEASDPLSSPCPAPRSVASGCPFSGILTASWSSTSKGRSRRDVPAPGVEVVISRIGTYLPVWSGRGGRQSGPDEDAITIAVAAGRAALEETDPKTSNSSFSSPATSPHGGWQRGRTPRGVEPVPDNRCCRTSGGSADDARCAERGPHGAP